MYKFFSSRRRHTRFDCDWSSDVCSSDLSRWPGLAATLQALLWPTLLLLLYATFVQVPLLHLREACADRRFISALLVGNFLLVPVLVWGLLHWLPDDPVLRVGEIGRA